MTTLRVCRAAAATKNIGATGSSCSEPSRLRKNVIFEPIFLMAGRRQVRMMAAGARRVRAVRPVLLSSSFLQTDSSRRCQKLWDADNVVGGGSENEEPRDEGPPAMTGLAHHADSLHPGRRAPRCACV